MLLCENQVHLSAAFHGGNSSVYSIYNCVTGLCYSSIAFCFPPKICHCFTIKREWIETFKKKKQHYLPNTCFNISTAVHKVCSAWNVSAWEWGELGSCGAGLPRWSVLKWVLWLHFLALSGLGFRSLLKTSPSILLWTCFHQRWWMRIVMNALSFKHNLIGLEMSGLEIRKVLRGWERKTGCRDTKSCQNLQAQSSPRHLYHLHGWAISEIFRILTLRWYSKYHKLRGIQSTIQSSLNAILQLFIWSCQMISFFFFFEAAKAMERFSTLFKVKLWVSAEKK